MIVLFYKAKETKCMELNHAILIIKSGLSFPHPATNHVGRDFKELNAYKGNKGSRQRGNAED